MSVGRFVRVVKRVCDWLVWCGGDALQRGGGRRRRRALTMCLRLRVIRYEV